jgi:hypothetical protein
MRKRFYLQSALIISFFVMGLPACMASSPEEELQQSLAYLKTYLQETETISPEIVKALRTLLPYQLPAAPSSATDEVQFHLYYKTTANKFEETIETLPLPKAHGISEGKNFNFAKEETYHRFIGQVRTCFENLSPLYGSCVALNERHFLTLASCVTWYGKAPRNITVFSYNHEKDAYINKNEVNAVRLTVKFMRKTQRASKHDFALLTLKSSIADLKGHTLPFFPHPVFNTAYLEYELYGFNEVYNTLKHFKLEMEEKGHGNKDFIVYGCENSFEGSGGSPLFAHINERYYLIGLHMNGVKSHKKALHLTAVIQETIAQMQAAADKGAITQPTLPEVIETLEPARQRDKDKEKVDVLPKNREVQEEPEGIVFEKQADDPLSVDIKTRNKALIASKEPKIFKVRNRNNVDSYLKITFAPNLLPLMKKKFIGLDASNTDITKEGLKLAPKTFKVLNLKNCLQITDEALEIIKLFTALEMLNLDGCPTTIKDLEELRKHPSPEKEDSSYKSSGKQGKVVSSSSFKVFDSGSE